jgi:DNA-binding NtrC family response regulator
MSTQHDSWAPPRVLILDDDEDLALCLHDVLELRHHEVRVAHNLDTARSELAAQPPDVFVVDLFIGTRRSDELLAAVHQAMPWVRCVLISGSERSAWNHLVEQGVVETALRKPFGTDELIALVEKLVEKEEEEGVHRRAGGAR